LNLLLNKKYKQEKYQFLSDCFHKWEQKVSLAEALFQVTNAELVKDTWG